MFRKKPVLEPLKLKRKLPENGTYPPRLVMPGTTFWLRDDLEDLMFVKGNHNRWKLIPDDKHEVLLNGEKLHIATTLSDGDYIRQEPWKAIFQVDPVADYKKALQQEDLDDVIEINPSQKLRDWIRLDYDGISLDAGENFTRWDEIVRIAYGSDGNSKWRVDFYRVDNGKKDKKIPSKLKPLSRDDFKSLIDWISWTAPFWLSTLNSWFEDIWIDAYTKTAYIKLLIPAENNQQLLPEKAEKIFQRFETSKWGTLLWFISLFGVILVLSVVMAKPDDLSLESIIAVAVGFIVISGFLGVLWGLMRLEWWYREYKYKKLAKADEASKESD